MIWRSPFEDIKLRYAATLTNGYVMQARREVPMNVRGIGPENTKWSNYTLMSVRFNRYCVYGPTFFNLSAARPYVRKSWVACILKLSSTLVYGARSTYVQPRMKNKASRKPITRSTGARELARHVTVCVYFVTRSSSGIGHINVTHVIPGFAVLTSSLRTST